MFASVTSTLGLVATAVPTVADWLLPALKAILAAAPAVPVAVKVTGEPERPLLVAVSVFVPAVVPRVQLPTVAMPAEFVVAEPPLTEPPPDATAKVTAIPETGLLFGSVTSTLGLVATAVPAVADWLLPALRAILAAAPAVPVAVNVTGEPVRPLLVAVSVFVPAVVPRVQLPTVAMPAEFVVAEPPVTEPPPDATAKVTAIPETGLLFGSVTSTLGLVATAVPAVADWLLPALSCSQLSVSCDVDASTAVELAVVKDAAEKAPSAAAVARRASATKRKSRRFTTGSREARTEWRRPGARPPGVCISSSAECHSDQSSETAMARAGSPISSRRTMRIERTARR